MPFAVELPRLLQCQGALAPHDFRGARARAQQPREIGLSQTGLLHAEADGFDGIGRIDRPALRFPGLDQRRQNVEAVRGGRAALRLALEVHGDLVQCAVVVRSVRIGAGPYWRDMRGMNVTVAMCS